MSAAQFLSTAQLRERYANISSRTLKRWQESRQFPKPTISHKGSPSMYSLDDVLEWEKQLKQADTVQ